MKKKQKEKPDKKQGQERNKEKTRKAGNVERYTQKKWIGWWKTHPGEEKAAAQWGGGVGKERHPEEEKARQIGIETCWGRKSRMVSREPPQGRKSVSGKVWARDIPGLGV